MNPSRLALALMAGAGLISCSAHDAGAKINKQLLIVQIDEATLGSYDSRFHVYPIPHKTIDAMMKRLKDAGARVVVVDTRLPNDPTAMAVDAVQRYTGKAIDLTSLARDDKGQMKLDPVKDVIMHVRGPRGNQIVEHYPVFAGTESFSVAFTQPIDQLKGAVDGKLVYLGYAAEGITPSGAATAPFGYPHVFADARLADQLMSSAGRPGN